MPPKVTGISESAVGSPNIAAGSYISIYGTNLANPNSVGNNTFLGGDAPSVPSLPHESGRRHRELRHPGIYDGKPADYNGAPGFFTFVSQAGTQLNVMVPWELQGATSALVKVTVDGIADSNVLTIPLVTYAPQLFQNGGIAAAIDATTYARQSGPDLGVESRARRGFGASCTATAWGRSTISPPAALAPTFDPLPATKSPCTVTVGGMNAPGIVLRVGGVPGGVPDQHHCAAGLAAGNQPVVLTTGGVSSKAANLPVK